MEIISHFDHMMKWVMIKKIGGPYRYVYNCESSMAIKTLRENYSKDEIESIYKCISKSRGDGSYRLLLWFNNPFKE